MGKILDLKKRLLQKRMYTSVADQMLIDVMSRKIDELFGKQKKEESDSQCDVMTRNIGFPRSGL